MKYIKSYKIFEASDEQNEYLSDIRTEINYMLLKLKEEGDMDISINTHLLAKQYHDPSEYHINISINNCDKIEKFTDEIRTLFSYLEEWSPKSTIFTTSKSSYCDIKYFSDVFETSKLYFKNIDKLLKIISHCSSTGNTIEGITIKFFKLI